MRGTNITLNKKDIMALEAAKNADIVQPTQGLGKSAGNSIDTRAVNPWPNCNFVLDNSGSSVDRRFLLCDPTGELGFFLGAGTYETPTSISPDLNFERLNKYLLRINLGIDTLKLQTSSDPAQFDQKFDLVYGLPGSFNIKDISGNIEFLQDPGNYTQLLLKGVVNPLIPMDVANSPLITVLAGEIYRVSASFKIVNGLPVAGMVNQAALSY